jgi:2-haloacid dehalogenase
MRREFVSFDCYGTLINFQMDQAIVDIFGDRLADDLREAFIEKCDAYRFDEVLGDWKPYREVIARATARVAAHFDVEYRAADGDALYDAVPTWGPHANVPEALKELADQYRLVILSNAADEQIMQNVQKLGAPFHAVLTAEQAQAYKPRFRAFEFMLEALSCTPANLIHVSSSPMYDLRPARDLGIGCCVLINRGYEPDQPWLGYEEITNIRDLPELVDDISSAVARR